MLLVLCVFSGNEKNYGEWKGMVWCEFIAKFFRLNVEDRKV